MSAVKNKCRVNTSEHLPFKEEGLRLTREYNASVSDEEWSWEDLVKYRHEHGSPEYLAYLERVKGMKFN